MLTRPLRVDSLLPLVIAALCFCATATAQQENCSLKFSDLKDAPELKGFRLGMTTDEVKAIAPLVQMGGADEFGVMKTTINPHFDPRFDRTIYADVRTISFDFLDGKLSTLWIGYEETFKWPRLDEFIANFSKSLNLPADWPMKRPGRQLTCNGFSVFASIIAAGPSIKITDEAAQDLIATRREEATAAAEAQVIGDTSSKSYYPSDCPAKEDVPPLSRVVFKNKDEAEKAGYKLAKDCE